MAQKDFHRAAIIAKLANGQALTPEQLAIGVQGALNVSSDFYNEAITPLKNEGVIVEENGKGRGKRYRLSPDLLPHREEGMM